MCYIDTWCIKNKIQLTMYSEDNILLFIRITFSSVPVPIAQKFKQHDNMPVINMNPSSQFPSKKKAMDIHKTLSQSQIYVLKTTALCNVKSITLASCLVQQSTNAKPLCDPIPTIFLGNLKAFNSPKVLSTHMNNVETVLATDSSRLIKSQST